MSDETQSRDEVYSQPQGNESHDTHVPPPPTSPESPPIASETFSNPVDDGTSPDTTPGQRLSTVFGRALTKGLDDLEPGPIATFAWADHPKATTPSGRLSIALLERVSARKLTLAIHGEDGQAPMRVTASVGVHQQGPDRVTLKLQTNQGNSEFAIDLPPIDAWLEGDVTEVTLRKPKSMGAPEEYFAPIWYPEGDTPTSWGAKAVCPRIAGIGVESSSRPWGRYQAYRPRWDANAQEWRATLPSPPNGEEAHDDRAAFESNEWAAFVLAQLAWRTSLEFYADVFELGDSPDIVRPCFPSRADYLPGRSVDLRPADVSEALTTRGIKIPWHVVEAACSALNAGKHLILTGPPGCGKTQLARTLAEQSGNTPLVATASPAWTSNDLIGRYLPSPDGRGVVFSRGFLLNAINEPRHWLIIDEFNRADIDACFGELFTVLAGEKAELPFRERASLAGTDASDDEDLLGLPIEILPASSSGVDASRPSLRTRSYQVSETFRIVGTMNDADRSSLSQLSYALLRRFSIIRVEAPDAAVVAEYIKGLVPKVFGELGLETLDYRLECDDGQCNRKSLHLDRITAPLLGLFANPKPARDFSDLVAERIVGMATIKDIVHFVAEGLRAPDNDVPTVFRRADFKSSSTAQEVGDAVALSYLAIAVVLNVFPQLDQLSAAPDRLRKAIDHILATFADVPFLRIVRNTTSTPGAAPTTRFTIVKTRNDISSHLHDELKLQFGGRLPTSDGDSIDD